MESEQKKRKFWKGKKKWIVGLIAVLIVGGIYFGSRGNGVSYDLVKVSKMDIVDKVESTGKVREGLTVGLSFLTGGKLDRVVFDSGNKVTVDAVLAELVNRDQELNLKRAQANLAAANANLNQKLAGVAEEDVEISRAKVVEAEAALNRAEVEKLNKIETLEIIKERLDLDIKKAELALKDAKDKLDSAGKSNVNTGLTADQALETARADLRSQIITSSGAVQQGLVNLKGIIIDDGNSEIGQDFIRLDYRLMNSAKENYFLAKQSFDPIYLGISSLGSLTDEELIKVARDMDEILKKLSIAVKQTLDALSVIPTSVSLSESKLNNFKTRLNSDYNVLSSGLAAMELRYQGFQTALVNKNSNLDSADSQVVNAQNVYDQQLQAFEQAKLARDLEIRNRELDIKISDAQIEIQKAQLKSALASLNLKVVPVREVDVAYLRAQVSLAGVDVSLAREGLEKTFLRAPFSGVISRKFKNRGEDVMQGEKVFELTSFDKLKVVADISESDINKIKVGTKVKVSVDALDDKVFSGSVVKIDSTETLIQDVVYYRVEIGFDGVTEGIKPGMSVDIDFILKEEAGVLVVPERAIQVDSEGKRFLRKLVNGEVKNVFVEVGVIDLDGNAQILSGVTEGEEFILKINTK